MVNERSKGNEMNTIYKHIAYANGVIRNAAGELIAFYDADQKQLSINGIVAPFRAEDVEQAMEIVGSYA